MPSKKNYTSAISFIIITFGIFFSIHSLMPERLITNKSTTEFSSENALNHLKKISEKPHFVGSNNHDEVRNYIVNELEKLGLTVEVQNQIAINSKWRAGTETKNILARIKGAEKGKALLLLSHYDSAPHSSFGASDAGSGVVAILEGVRAFLASNPKPKNDIIILISDAEELGLLGANAFVNHHPWAKEVGLVLNFEARGSGGPSILFIETNHGNKNLIKEFNQAGVKYPVANSLLYSIYKMLPNDTDATVFREDADIDSYNFAFIDDHFDYHTAQDNYERLDRKTLQHQVDYLMPLLKYFSNANLDNLNDEEDFVFFNFKGFGLVNYAQNLVIPILIIVSILFLLLIIVGINKKKLVFKEILIGFMPFIASLILSGSLAFYGWKLFLKIYPQYNDILHGFTYNGKFYVTGFIAIAVAIFFWIYNGFFKKYHVQNLLIAPIFVWLLINIAIGLYIPGAGFFIIPVIVALIVLGVLLFVKEDKSNKVLLFSLLTIPISLIFVPLIQLFPIGLGLKMTVISIVLTILIMGIFLPIFSSYKSIKHLSKLFFLIGVLSLVSASFSSNYSTERKKPNSVLYILDSDKDESYWASYNHEVDTFTKQFLGEYPTKGSFVKQITSSKYGTNFNLYAKAKRAPIPQPLVTIVKDTLINDIRNISLKIVPQRKVNRLEIMSKETLHFITFKVSGEALKNTNEGEFLFNTDKNKQVLSYYFTKDNSDLELEFSIPKDENPNMEIFESSYDLYSNDLIHSIQDNITPRSAGMIPTPFVLNDAVVVKKSIIFE